MGRGQCEPQGQGPLSGTMPAASRPQNIVAILRARTATGRPPASNRYLSYPTPNVPRLKSCNRRGANLLKPSEQIVPAPPEAPPDRLRALVQTLWTVRDAGISMRGPLKAFYDTLTVTQKSSFASQQPQDSPPSDPKYANPGMNKQYQACASQNAEKAERMIKEIEMRSPAKQGSGSELRRFPQSLVGYGHAADCLMRAADPADPMARLDAANDQLTAINYAATTVQIAFDDFYLKLSNDQKSRFRCNRYIP